MRRLSQILAFTLFLILAYSCAKVVAPEGGARDKEGPILVESQPEFGAVNFNGNSIELRFNEYIKAGQLASQLLITPPLSGDPEIKASSKSIKISWKEELKQNTTYLFQFGEGLVDLTEGNPAEQNFFVFSTGNHLDSGKLSVHIKALETGLDVESAVVMLYDSASYNFSMLTDSTPNYIAKAKEGKANMQYLKPGRYMLFAIEDENKDYKYQAGERVAYLNHAIEIVDSSHVELSTFLAQKKHKKPLAKEQDSCTIVLSFPNGKSEELKLQLLPSLSKGMFWNKNSDSLFINYPLYQVDSLLIISELDENIDTLSIKPRGLKEKKLSLNVNKRKYHPQDSVKLFFNKLLLDYKKDSLVLKGNQHSFTLPYQLSKNVLSIAAPDSAGNYEISFLPGELKSNCSSNSDSLGISISISETSAWGSLSFTDSDTSGASVLYQLIRDKEVVFETQL